MQLSGILPILEKLFLYVLAAIHDTDNSHTHFLSSRQIEYQIVIDGEKPQTAPYHAKLSILDTRFAPPCRLYLAIVTN